MSQSLSDKINALPAVLAADGFSVSREAVLDLVKDAFLVEVDPEAHAREPRNAEERFVWATLDTAFRVLGVGAVRSVMRGLAEQAAAQNVPWESDEEIFRLAGESGDPDAATSYAGLIPNDAQAKILAARSFYRLLEVTNDIAVETFNETV
jgi:hypothetical protein